MSILKNLESSFKNLVSTIEKLHLNPNKTADFDKEAQDQYDINEYEKMASDIKKIREAIASIKSES